MASGFPKPSETTGFPWNYINLVDSQDIVAKLKAQTEEMALFYAAIPQQKWDYAYAPGKWTLKGSIRHLIDSERVFAYRLLRFLRKDSTALPGFDQDAYMESIDVEQIVVADLLKEWRSVRDSTQAMLESVRPEDWDLSGVASGVKHTVRAVAFTLTGHELHHKQLTLAKYLD